MIKIYHPTIQQKCDLTKPTHTKNIFLLRFILIKVDVTQARTVSLF